MFTGRGTTRTAAHPVELLTLAAGALDLKRLLVVPFFRMRPILYSPAPREAPMLPPFIIEEIRKREADRKRRDEQPRLELPLDRPRPAIVSDDRDKDQGPGMLIIEVL